MLYDSFPQAGLWDETTSDLYDGMLGEVGTHMLRYAGMCCENELVSHQKSLDTGPILVNS